MQSTETEQVPSADWAALSPRRQAILARLIDAAFYAAQAGLDPTDSAALATHYVDTGWRDGLDPSSTFQAARYSRATPGMPTDRNPFAYYLFDVVGEDLVADALGDISVADIARLRAHFDAAWYLETYPDVAASGNDPFVHYMTLGWRERRDPSAAFSTGAYSDLHADVRTSDTNPLRHWVLHGIAEGRSDGRAMRSALTGWDDLGTMQQTVLTRMVALDYYRVHIDGAEPGDPQAPARQVAGGRARGGYVTPSFHAARYAATRPDLRDTGEVPFLHYLFRTVGEDMLRDLFVGQSPAVLHALTDHFDTDWYLYSYPDIEASGQDAFIHFMTVGWREGRDPSQDFSTKIYLLRYADIAEAGINPFLHWVGFGKAEGRSGMSSANNFRSRPYAPVITALLVNDAADPLTADAITAVLAQSYARMAVMVAGDPLADDARAALDAGLGRRGDIDLLTVPADEPNVLERATAAATGELLWYVRGRAVHDTAFLARLASSFADGSVQLGFGRCLTPEDADYAVSAEELARRMEGWSRHPTTPAALWFAEQLRAETLTADQPGFLWRRRTLPAEAWHEAAASRHLGLWHLFLHMASGGQIATVRDAVLRLPPTATPRADIDVAQDIDRLAGAVRLFWGTPDADGVAGGAGRTRRHVLIVTHGIFAGGAENLPIQLANALAARGLIVSMLIFKTELNPEMRATLDPGCSIYEADWVMEYGADAFLRDIGCSLIHSHGVIGEMFFYRLCEDPLPAPYVATLHGSYEAASDKELPETFIARIVRNVDLFVYTADKNLGPLLRHDVAPDRIVKMINAMPVDPAPFPRTRAEMGIAEDAVVFTLVARGIREKGWATAVTAFKAVQARHPDRAMHLCLVGEGDEPDRLMVRHGDDPSISFLGFQLRIHGLYRMTDVAIVPTRFAGESFPLCIIQALQVSTPVIATDVGEIASMLEVDGVSGGITVPYSLDDRRFDAGFTEAMDRLIDDGARHALAQGATVLARTYDMDVFTDQYVRLYEDVIHRFADDRKDAVS
ncbi:glycosyltransferase family 4 protein [Sphingomonas sp. Leaf33]|uniref:glycosyltransferase family 4 protein n=1 Tax=Sphingomonas sp. Leaf33 TaxID=1736215 RepID=UPI001F1C5630|nr:glycosyltransferase family 4 protein [Sphingomonas sp. Leaf33]